MPLLEVKELTVSFGVTKALDGLSVELGKGDRLGIVGESGAGKSVLALALTGLLPPSAEISGAIAFDGAPLPGKDSDMATLRGRRIGLVPQDASEALDPLLTIGAQLAEALELAGKPDAEREKALLAEAGLAPEDARRYPRDLSATQRKLATLMIALAAEPELLIADDPGAGLDLLAQRRVVDLLVRHSAARAMALVLISPDLKLLVAVCNRLVVLKAGVAVETGETMTALMSPRHEHARMLVTAGRHRPKMLMRAPIGPPLLEVNKISRRFTMPGKVFGKPAQVVTALDDVSFVLRTGECVALTGPAGSGKSTLLKMIAGLDRASSGEMKFDTGTYHGTDLQRMFRRDIGYVFSNPALAFDPRRPVGDSVAEPMRLEPQRIAEEIAERIVEAVQAVGLSPDLLTKLPGALPLGQRQRLAVARALISKPRLILLDDPLAKLDVLARGEMLVLLNRLRADFGVTLMVATDDFETINRVADRVMVIDKGTIVETNTPPLLLDSPEQPITKQLVAARLPEVGGAG